MTDHDSPIQKLRETLSARRMMLLGTTILSLGVAALIVAPDAARHAAFAQNVTQQAQTVQRPTGFADIVEKVKPAVISVRVKVDNTPQLSSDDNGGQFPHGFERFFRRFGMPEDMIPNAPLRPRGRSFSTGQGSGFFISADGYAVTNNHVVEKAEKVEIATDDGKTYTAKVIGTDPRTDLALIKVDGRTDFPYATLADHQPRIGDWVLAVGNPFGLGGTVTAGIVSARGRDIGAGPYDDFLQIDAPVNKGNSGGPDLRRRWPRHRRQHRDLLAVGRQCRHRVRDPGFDREVRGHATQGEGRRSTAAGSAFKSSRHQDIADSLGLKKPEGALVADPQADGPAAKAGIEAGDVIVAVNGERVKDARELAKQDRRHGARYPRSSSAFCARAVRRPSSLTLGELPNAREARAESWRAPAPPVPTYRSSA